MNLASQITRSTQGMGGAPKIARAWPTRMLGALLALLLQYGCALAQIPYHAPPQFAHAQANGWRAQNDAWQAQIDAWKAQQDAQNALHTQTKQWQPVPDAPPAQPQPDHAQAAPAPVQMHSWPSPATPLPVQPYAASDPFAARSLNPVCERDPGRPGCEPGQGHAAPSYPRQPGERPSPAKVAAAVALTVLAVGVVAAIAGGPLITPAMFAGMKW